MDAGSAKMPSTKIKSVVPKGWYFHDSHPGSYQFELSADRSPSSKRSASIRSLKVAKKGFAYLAQTISPYAYSGKRVKLSGYMKTKDVKGWAGLWMRLKGFDDECTEDEEERTLGYDNMEELPVVGDTNWKKYEIVLDVPVESNSLVFGGMLNGEGTVWLDDFKLEIVTDKLKTTGNIHKSCGMEYQVKEPTNLDFSQGLRPKNSDKEISEFPIGWFKLVGDSKPIFGIEPVSRTSNEKSIFIENSTSSYGGFWQAVECYKSAGKRLKLSADIKTEKVSAGNAGLTFRADIGWKHSVTSDYSTGREIAGTTNWTNHNCVIDIPEKSENFYIGGWMNGKGKSWFKNFKVEEVGKEVATTGPDGSLVKAAKKVASNYEKSNYSQKPVNLKFNDKRNSENTAHKNVPFGWFVGDMEDPCYEVKTELRDITKGGGKCVVFSSIKPSENGFGTFMQMIDAKLYRGKRMRFSADIKTRDAKQAALWMRIDGPHGVTLGFDNMDNRPIGKNTDWKRYSCVLDVPKESQNIALGMLMVSGNCCFSNMAFEEVSAEVPSTCMTVFQPVNMSFEED